MVKAMISELIFHHRLIRSLPGRAFPPTPSRQTPGIFYAETPPTPVSRPELLIWSPETAALLGLPTHLPAEDARLVSAIFSGNELPPGTRPYATRYGGHQFGVWAGQLGDGRAIALGELRNSRGEFFEVQLKGAGPTPYSRTADGRAVLRSSLREFLCSEAMHHLRIPTTRALCCVTTGDAVIRDMFYDGNPQPEPGAITTRVAPSFLRLGHFEILAASDENELLRELVKATIEHLYPDLAKRHDLTASSNLTSDLLLEWISEVANRTIDLMVEWQRVGFVHGVMNTDNLSILGLTIDYGPYGWLDAYDPEWTPNTTDSERRRYRFGHQPSVALWNLSRFASAVLPLFDDSAAAVRTLEERFENYRSRFGSKYLSMRCRKLGFQTPEESSPPESLRQLLHQLDELLISTETDMTLFYRLLTQAMQTAPKSTPQGLLESISDCFYAKPVPQAIETAWLQWLSRFQQLWNTDAEPPASRVELMETSNPYFILRNYLVQEALDALANQDPTVMMRLMDALKTPYTETDQTRPYFKKRPEWARTQPGCSSLSCSS